MCMIYDRILGTIGFKSKYTFLFGNYLKLYSHPKILSAQRQESSICRFLCLISTSFWGPFVLITCNTKIHILIQKIFCSIKTSKMKHHVKSLKNEAVWEAHSSSSFIVVLLQCKYVPHHCHKRLVRQMQASAPHSRSVFSVISLCIHDVKSNLHFYVLYEHFTFHYYKRRIGKEISSQFENETLIFR